MSSRDHAVGRGIAPDADHRLRRQRFHEGDVGLLEALVGSARGELLRGDLEQDQVFLGQVVPPRARVGAHVEQHVGEPHADRQRIRERPQLGPLLAAEQQEQPPHGHARQRAIVEQLAPRRIPVLVQIHAKPRQQILERGDGDVELPHRGGEGHERRVLGAAVVRPLEQLLPRVEALHAPPRVVGVIGEVVGHPRERVHGRRVAAQRLGHPRRGHRVVLGVAGHHRLAPRIGFVEGVGARLGAVGPGMSGHGGEPTGLAPRAAHSAITGQPWLKSISHVVPSGTGT